MGQLVAPEITVAAKDLAALVALVRFVVRVREEVGLQVGPLVEAPLANGAFVGGLLHVQDLVHGQGSGLTEPLAALRALERLLLRVDVAVVPEMILPAERLAAQVARVGPLIRVSPLMNEEVVGLGELAAAELAYELLFCALLLLLLLLLLLFALGRWQSGR